MGLVQPKNDPQAQPAILNISDSGSVDPVLIIPQVNASILEVEASTLGGSRTASAGDDRRSSSRASEFSIVPPMVLEVSVPQNPSIDVEEGEICGESQCSDDGEVSILEAEEVRVDLAVVEFDLGLPAMVGSPITASADDLQLMVVPGALEVESTLPVVEYYDVSVPHLYVALLWP